MADSKYKFTVNAAPGIVSERRPGKEFTMHFIEQIAAEAFMEEAQQHGIEIVEYNFEAKHTPDEIESWRFEKEKAILAANKAQAICRDITQANWMRPDLVPCEVCGEKHENYNCCEGCNYQDHRCHFCGDDLGHGGVSTCYILDGKYE